MEEDFKSWFLSHGGAFHPDTDIGFNSDGFFIRVRDGRDLPPGSLVVSCPHALVISGLDAIHDPLLGQFDLQTVSPLLNQVVITRFFLMKQFLLREKSLWWQYIRMLPQPDARHKFNTPLWYAPEDLAWIRGTNLELGAQRMQTLWRQEYEEAASLFGWTVSELTESWSWSLYKWAAAIFTSRSFPGSALANSTSDKVSNALDLDCPVLIPGVDLLNHRPLAKVTWIWGSSDCSIINDDPIGRTTQIWNNYGPKSNEELILGYGFSVFRNPAEFCSLAVSLDVEKRILTIKNSQPGPKTTEISTVGGPSELTGRLSEGPEIALGTPDLGKGHNIGKSKLISKNRRLIDSRLSAQRANRQIKWVRLKGGSLKNNPGQSQALYEFSPGFLGDCSIAFANERELAEFDFPLHSSVDFSLTQPSRNKVHVMCAVTMILQRQQMAITKHASDLPRWPANEKQFHAARYRRNQLQILKSVAEILLESLRSLPGISIVATRDVRVIRLENILTDSTSSILTDFRAALNSGLGTRNPAKIRKNGWVECAFTLWLCGLWLRHCSNIYGNASPTSSLPPNLSRWLVFLSRVYWSAPRIEPNKEHVVDPIKSDARVTLGVEVVAPKQSYEETQLLCKSFLAVIRATVTKNPRSLYGDPSVTIAHLERCLNVIRQEGVMCPNLEGEVGEESDEYVLFLEDAGIT